jgi:DNA-directed RNA polymerase specialized sigma24 family protein
MEPDRSAFYCKQALAQLPRIERLAARRFKDGNFADEAVNFVLDQLQQDDWRRVRAYQGEAKFETYLTTVVQRLLEDFATRKFGKSRIPTEVAAGGPLWVVVFRRLCVERLSLAETIERVVAEAPRGRDPALVEEVARAIRGRYPRCGSPNGLALITSTDDYEALNGSRDHVEEAWRHDPNAGLIAREQEKLLRDIRATMLDPEPEATDPVPGGGGDDLRKRLGDRLGLSPEDRLLLKMVYQDGLKVTAAGEMLGWGPHQTHGKLRRLLARIHKVCEGLGIDPSVTILP